MQEVLHMNDEKIIRVFSDPLHVRMLTALEDSGPMTSAGLARIFNDEPARMHYHLKKMEQAGILELDHVEQVNGINARYLRPSAKKFTIVPTNMHGNPKAAYSSVAEMIRERYGVARDRFIDSMKNRSDNPENDNDRLSVWFSDELLHLTETESLEFKKGVSALLHEIKATSEKNKEDSANKDKYCVFHSFLSLVKLEDE